MADEPNDIDDLIGTERLEPLRARSIGIVVPHRDPVRASRLCADVAQSVPRGVHTEFLVLDDHTNLRRSEVIAAVDRYGDSVRVVPRPGGGPASEYDATSLASCSEFLGVPVGQPVPWGDLARALEELWSDGADCAVVAQSLHAEGCNDGRGHTDRHAGLGAYLGISAAPNSEPTGSNLTDSDPTVSEPPDPPPESGRLVVLRRWAARWMFSEPSGVGDPCAEIADRAQLLGLRVAEIEVSGPHRCT